ncbi:MAG TPA: beta-ketoacyl-[acyl-carrier-protein] synthase family protein [Pyrinomonadaceae bacterium]|nr:beta-ketoacyl-[acyl-carrier-protein] synthase family protein [Pyrinomonadaceae bacterium]
MRTRVVITGLGIVSPVGIGREAFWTSLTNGRTGIKPITLFDTSKVECKTAGEITDLDVKEALPGIKTGMLYRTAQLSCVAAKLGLDDAGIELTAETKPRIGVMIGNTLGVMRTYSEFYRTALTGGYIAASPMDFANIIAITVAGYVSIVFGVSNFNSVISSGELSGLDAINYGASFIRNGKADMVLAGGVESLSLETYLLHYLPKFLSGSTAGQREFCAPFGRGRNGFVLGEAGAVVLLEDYEHAVARGARIYAELRGYGATFDGHAFFSSTPASKGLTRAISLASKRSGLSPEDIDYVSAGANSSVAGDQSEADAIRNVFGSTTDRLHISAIKSMIGESLSASTGVQVCASALALHEGVIPPTINSEEQDSDCNIPLFSESREVKIKTALICAGAPSGLAGALVLSTPQ